MSDSFYNAISELYCSSNEPNCFGSLFFNVLLKKLLGGKNRNKPPAHITQTQKTAKIGLCRGTFEFIASDCPMLYDFGVLRLDNVTQIVKNLDETSTLLYFKSEKSLI